MEKHSRRNAIALMAGVVPALTATSIAANAVGPAASAAGSAIASLNAPELSPKIAAADVEWRKAGSAFKAAIADDMAANARFREILPDAAGWKRPPTPEQSLAIESAREISGVEATQAAADDACGEEHSRLIALLSLQPETMADVILQAKRLKSWLHDCSTEFPAEVWLETITGEAWPDQVLDESESA